MPSELIINSGITICAGSVLCAMVAAVLLRRSKRRLDQKLDAEYGKRRR